jgi:hypothetical protein
MAWPESMLLEVKLVALSLSMRSALSYCLDSFLFESLSVILSVRSKRPCL